MLEKEFAYFKSRHDELFSSYPNKYLIIKGNTVVYAAETFDEALKYALGKGMEIGTFLLQLCSEGSDAFTQTFHTRAIFA